MGTSMRLIISTQNKSIEQNDNLAYASHGWLASVNAHGCAFDALADG